MVKIYPLAKKSTANTSVLYGLNENEMTAEADAVMKKGGDV